LLLLSILTSIPSIIQFHHIVDEEFMEVQEMIQQKVPEFSISNGELKAQNNTPIIEERVNFTFVFDPLSTKLIAPVDGENVVVGLLKDKMLVRISNQEEVIPFKALEGTSISKEDVLGFFTDLEKMYPMLLGIMTGIIYITTCFAKFITVTFFASLVLLFSKSWRQRLSFKQSWNML